MNNNQYKIRLVENNDIILFEKIVTSSSEENEIINILINKINKDREIKVYEHIDKEWKLIRLLNIKKDL